jgi:hypothetical protein
MSNEDKCYGENRTDKGHKDLEKGLQFKIKWSWAGGLAQMIYVFA